MNDRLWEFYMKVVQGAGFGDPDAWARLDLSMPQMKVLMLLHAGGEMTVTALAERMGTSLPNMTGLLDRLESLSFVDRVPSTVDRRSVVTRLTDTSRDIFHQLSRSGREKLERALDVLTEEEVADVRRGLFLLAGALEAVSRDDPRK